MTITSSQSYSEITVEFTDAIGAFSAATRSLIPDDGDATVYRARLVRAMEHVKVTSMRVLQVGHMAGIEQLADLNKIINQLCDDEREPITNEIFWDVLADHYPPLYPNLWRNQNLPGPLQIKLGAGAIEQLKDPRYVPRQILETIPHAHFMDALTTVIQRLMPPYRRFNIGIHEILSVLGNRLSDAVFCKTSAADYLLAHQDLYFPLIKKLINIAQTQPIIAATDALSINDRNERYEHQLLGKLDYSPQEIDELYAEQQRLLMASIDYATKTGRTPEEIDEIRRKGVPLDNLPTTTTLQQINKSISWPAEFLVMLLERCQNPLIQELAQVAFDTPLGTRAYLHFEKMGFVRSPDWHNRAQYKSSIMKTLRLYEHAIHTNGIELSPLLVLNTSVTFKVMNVVFSEADKALLINILEHVDVKNPESLRKGKILFDALIARSKVALTEEWIELIKGSGISPKLFKKHKLLCVDILEERLGL